MSLKDRIENLERKINNEPGRCSVCGGHHVRTWGELVRLADTGKEWAEGPNSRICSCPCCFSIRSFLSKTIEVPFGAKQRRPDRNPGKNE